MITEQGRVVAIERDLIWIEKVQTSGCMSCFIKDRCEPRSIEVCHARFSGLYTQAVCSRLLKRGDIVLIGIPEDCLLKVAFITYLVPLCLMMLGIWISSIVWSEDWQLVIAAVCFLSTGYGLARLFGKWLSKKLCVHVLN